MKTNMLAAGLLLLLGLGVAGCSQDRDTGTVERDSPEKRQQAAESMKKQWEEIKNNPQIPEQQKQAILARMGGPQGGSAPQTEAQMKNQMMKKATPASGKP